MPEPELYTWYSADEAISFFGAPGQTQTVLQRPMGDLRENGNLPHEYR
jgi:hypothetical protein